MSSAPKTYEPLKAGILVKRASTKINWKTRYFTLSYEPGAELKYYISKGHFDKVRKCCTRVCVLQHGEGEQRRRRQRTRARGMDAGSPCCQCAPLSCPHISTSSSSSSPPTSPFSVRAPAR